MIRIARQFSTKVVTKKQVFFDTLTLRVIGGTGGRGVSSFQMIQPGKFTPTGGNGGKGGNVYLRVNDQLDTLTFPKLVYKAENGQNGKGKCMHGRGGRDLYIDIPVGTLVYKIKENEEIADQIFKESVAYKEAKAFFDRQMENHFGSQYEEIKESEDFSKEDCLEHSSLQENLMDSSSSAETNSNDSSLPNPTANPFSEISKELVFDSSFASPSEVFCIARGGKGGEGNRAWYERSKKQNLRYWGSNRDRRLQASYYKHDENHNKGENGEEVMILLQTQHLANIGLVGYPNAGKSTLLSKLSKTKPKIASYPFTTLRPIIGYVQYSDGNSISVADIPGIISGAHANRGLGLSFLRHIQRTKVLAYVIDVSDKEHLPNQVYREIQKELLHYDEELLKKNTVVIANKMDAEGAEEGLHLLRQCTKLPIIPVSAINSTNMDKVAHIFKAAFMAAEE